MKPLAAPVLGGMLSSLLHVLVVTPVIFVWLHERRLGLQHDVPLESSTRRSFARWPVLVALASTVALAATFVVWRQTRPAASQSETANGAVVQQVKADNLEIVLRSPTGTLRQGRNTFAIEFRSDSGTLVDVGAVHATANMRMPGMVMSGGLEVHRTAVPGRYEATAEFGMAGAWPMTIGWDGPAGQGLVDFEGTVQ
jgi:Cu(I)/Ag(I) efflux system membrane protein CusA/SilA